MLLVPAVLMQRFARVITSMNAHTGKQLQIMNFHLILTRMISSCILIISGTTYLNKMIYALVNLDLNNFQNLLNFQF